MQSENNITHRGIIQEIENKTITVGFVAQEACSVCDAKMVCGASEAENKIVEISDFTDHQYKIGEQVDIVLQQSLGYKALFLAYVLPFLLVFLMLLILSAFFTNELAVGAVSILILLPYYIFLYYFRARLKRTFTFTLKKV